MSASFLSATQELAFYRPRKVSEFEHALEALLTKAKQLGADSAEATLIHGTSFSMDYRLGNIEGAELAESTRWGVRLFLGKRQACVSSNDFSPEVYSRLLTQTLSIAKLTPEDPYCGLADPESFANAQTRHLDLESYDQTVPTPAQLQERVLACEQAALDVPGVTSSEGASISWEKSVCLLQTSNGFSGCYQDSSFGLGASVLAERNGDKQRDAYGHSAVYWRDLEGAQSVGHKAGKRAADRLNPIKLDTATMPVVYDPLISPSLLGHLLGAIKGSEIARGTSFLQQALGTAIFPSHVTIVDDPLRKRGFGSRPFDGEGLACTPRKIVETGVLTSWLLNLQAARQLTLAPTGHGGLSMGGTPGISCSNFYMLPGTDTVEGLLSPIERGFYVTELMGFGVNSLTGDYSMGASGFLIEKGKITTPVHEVTIASTLPHMFQNLTPANDLVFRGAVSAPTLRIAEMTVAGAG